MSHFTVKGGAPLFGEITVSGSKNAALPILFATVATRGVSVVRRVPDIGDVRSAIAILRHLGARITRTGDTLAVDTTELVDAPVPTSLTASLRASTYLIGACLARFSHFSLSDFGGCNFSPRPIDMHLDASRLLGATLTDCILTAPRGLRGAQLSFAKPSVGATINALIMSATARGRTVIRGFAREPHVLCLIDFLLSAGASIEVSDREITVEGRELHGGDVTVIGDMIEAGTYLAAALMTDGSVTVRGVARDEIASFLELLAALGAPYSLSDSSVSVRAVTASRFVRVVALPYPGFPTDLQPIAAPLLARLSGGEITDRVWCSRFGYLDALSPLGVTCSRFGSSAVVHPSRLHSGITCAPDLRGGMACILAALAAEGESRIDHAETILRGYEDPVGKLSALGASLILES